MKNNLKRIMALITVILIVCFVIATFIIACLDFPNKETVFFSCMIGLIVLPIIGWILMWISSTITGRKNVASYRTEEMEETMRQADEIRFKKALEEGAASGEEETE
jgi:uncharacterized membrane protein